MPSTPEILAAVRASQPRGMRPKDVARHFGVKGTAYRTLRDTLRSLEQGGRLLKLRGGRLAVSVEQLGSGSGVLSLIRSGAGFVSLDDVGDDVYVPKESLGSAMHGDRVEIEIEPARPGRRASGSVIRVVSRNPAGLVGVVRGSTSQGARRPGARRPVVELAGPGPSKTLEIAAGDATYQDGDVVILRVTERGARRERVAGQIVDVLGSDSDPRVDSLRVIRQFGLTEHFPKAVEDEALAWAAKESERGEKNRKDHTALHVLTIDPADARDHDDALSAVRLPGSGFEVGVHIADVSFYVRPGSAIDREARHRANSTYLIDRAVPMLPEVLSSDVCSLKSGKDRRSVSLFFRVKADGTVVSTRLERCWIRPNAVLSYETAQGILEGVEAADSASVQSLHILRDLAEILRIRRVNRGALDFDLPEAHVVLGPDGGPTAIHRRLRLEAHRIIEEWMLAANEAMARKCVEEGLHVLYRVHDAPDPERTETLSALAAASGHDVPRSWSTRALQQLLDATRGQPEEGVVHGAVLRAMRRATYEPRASEHFGLAVNPYTHFTSPIRRYSDLHLHQTLDGTLLPSLPSDGGARAHVDSEEEALELARHTTDRERVSDQAGRESVELARLRFMAERVGETFSGVITRVLSWGFFVTLDDAFVEGLVHVRTLDDHYELNESSGVLVGARRGLTFKDGDAVTIRVTRVNRLERQIDFELLERTAGATDQKARHSDQ